MLLPSCLCLQAANSGAQAHKSGAEGDTEKGGKGVGGQATGVTHGARIAQNGVTETRPGKTETQAAGTETGVNCVHSVEGRAAFEQATLLQQRLLSLQPG